MYPWGLGSYGMSRQAFESELIKHEERMVGSKVSFERYIKEFTHFEEHTEADWDILYDVLVKGQFLVTQQAVGIMKKQSIGGDILNIVSKNALVSGPNNAGYGSAKAAQLHLSRLNAAELGKDKIRVNVVNPDAVIAGSNIWSGGWAEGRAKAYGVKVEELPQYYAGRTLLNEIILPEDIANACFAYVSGLLNKSTGNTINVDGGIATSFVR
jgi:NAD(P)-dependent dehydrogenase (short-subunit alcohol dehydrogenase family)